jgi:hypothetical protein
LLSNTFTIGICNILINIRSLFEPHYRKRIFKRFSSLKQYGLDI